MDVTFLGGCEEIGANSSFYKLQDTGIFIDSGIHPNKNDKEAFPKIELVINENTDYLILTHAHTDHIGALPYFLKYFPHLKILAHKATIDLMDFMISDLSKILKFKQIEKISLENLNLYNQEIIEKIHLISNGLAFNQKIELLGKRGTDKIDLELFPAGHILGASSILFSVNGKTILHTGDINFNNQFMLKGANLPNHHIDTLLIESTNALLTNQLNYTEESKLFAKYINDIVNEGGSILIPAFSLGKTQEILKLIYNLMRKGSIPKIPIYNGGLSTRLSRIYDIYNYTTPRINPGFEITDIETNFLDEESMQKKDFLKTSAIVVTSNGMLQPGTKSYKLALEWFKKRNFGIAQVGYQDNTTPGYSLQESVEGKSFIFGEKKITRNCKFEKFRFSLHSDFDTLVNYIDLVKPSNLFVIHGSLESCEYLAHYALSELNIPRVVVPENGKTYQLFR